MGAAAAQSDDEDEDEVGPGGSRRRRREMERFGRGRLLYDESPGGRRQAAPDGWI